MAVHPQLQTDPFRDRVRAVACNLSQYQGAVKQALDVAAALTTAGKNLPSVEQWRRFRAAASGALPDPYTTRTGGHEGENGGNGLCTTPHARWARRRAPHRDAGGGSRDDQCQEGSKDDHVDSHRVAQGGRARVEGRRRWGARTETMTTT